MDRLIDGRPVGSARIVPVVMRAHAVKELAKQGDASGFLGTIVQFAQIAVRIAFLYLQGFKKVAWSRARLWLV